MKFTDFDILEQNPNNMSKEDLNQYINLMQKLRLEFDDTQEPEPREDWLKLIRTKNPTIDQTFWTVFSKGEMRKAIGFASLTKHTKLSQNYEKSKGQAGIRINLLKKYQRNGIGSRLLALIAKKARDQDIKLLQAITATESGKAFCEKYNGKLKHFSVANRLTISKVDWNLMQQWVDNGLRLAEETGTTIETYNVIPEDILEEYCQLYTQILEQAPRGELEDQRRITQKSYLDQLARFKQLRVVICTKIVREATGEISGITEIMYKGSKPRTIQQRFTGVKEEYRGKGLGKWLKADLMFHIRANLSTAQFVETGNAQNNAPIRSINERMGFEVYKQVWWFYLYPDDLGQSLSK